MCSLIGQLGMLVYAGLCIHRFPRLFATLIFLPMCTRYFDQFSAFSNGRSKISAAVTFSKALKRLVQSSKIWVDVWLDGWNETYGGLVEISRTWFSDRFRQYFLVQGEQDTSSEENKRQIASNSDLNGNTNPKMMNYCMVIIFSTAFLERSGCPFGAS